MNNMFLKSFLLSMSISVAGCTATTVERPINQYKTQRFFSDVKAQVSQLNQQYGAENVLIVVDIDNTLLTSTVDLGGDVWYQWQRNKLELKPNETQQVSCLFEDSIGLLYELVPMVSTEKHLPQLVKQWQQSGNTLFALTSRAPKYRAATERELYRNGFDLEKMALAPKNQPVPVYRETVGRELSYMKGVMMTSGMNKGEMLDLLLDKTAQRFDAIVFVDDSNKNIVNVYQQYKNRTDIDMHIFHYINIEHQREQTHGAVLTKQQVNKMSKDWQTLTKTLNTLFPKRVQGNGCLSVN